MPIEIEDTDSGLGIIITASGILSEEDFFNAGRRVLLKDGDKSNRFKYCLWVYTKTEQIDFSTPALEHIAEMFIKAMKVNPDAIVATVADKDLAYGISRMFEALVIEEGWEIDVFKSKENAVEWIKERAKSKFGIDGLTFS